MRLTMKSPLRIYTDWWEREEERAKAKGGWQLLWHSLTGGLIWAIFMVALFTLADYYLMSDRHRTSDWFQSRAHTYFIIGMAVGLFAWIKHVAFGKGRPRD
jgi:ABC-type Fe3+ transport system permease subunit